MAAPDPNRPGSIGTAAAGTGTSVAPAYPISVQIDDIIFLLALSYQPNGIDLIALPSGFSYVFAGAISGPLFYNSVPSLVGRAGLFWRRADGSESGTITVTRTGDTGADTCFFAQTYCVRGCEPSGNPWDDAQWDDGPGNATVDWAAVTVSASERTLLAFCVQANDVATVDPPAGYAGAVRDTTTEGTHGELRLLYKQDVSSDGAVTATGGETAGWATFHVSVKPPTITPGARRILVVS